jgi:FkbM family methyltransferase
VRTHSPDTSELSLAVRVAAEAIRRFPVGRLWAGRWLSSKARGPFWARLSPALGSVSFRCDLRDGLMREAYLTGRYEPQETAIMCDVVLPGMTFVDVGANWGYFTLVGAFLTGPSGRVVAIEADPAAAAAVRANAAANGFETVEVINVAATDSSRELRFRHYEAAHARTAGNYGLAETARGDRADTVVAGRSLDDILDEAGVDHVDVLKMDIEGGEAAALRGIDRRLSAGLVDCVVLELHPAALLTLESSVGAVCRWPGERGLVGWLIDHSLDAHHRAGSGVVATASLLTPLDLDANLGAWPHVVWRRQSAP